MNEISLTVRMPQDLNDQLTALCKRLGLPKLPFLRFSVWVFLNDDPKDLIFDEIQSDSKFRFTFNVNKNIYDILETTSKRYEQSINSVVIKVANMALERYSTYL